VYCCKVSTLKRLGHSSVMDAQSDLNCLHYCSFHCFLHQCQDSCGNPSRLMAISCSALLCSWCLRPKKLCDLAFQGQTNSLKHILIPESSYATEHSTVASFMTNSEYETVSKRSKACTCSAELTIPGSCSRSTPTILKRYSTVSTLMLMMGVSSVPVNSCNRPSAEP
jgi:hypothetical protein